MKLSEFLRSLLMALWVSTTCFW